LTLQRFILINQIDASVQHVFEYSTVAFCLAGSDIVKRLNQNKEGNSKELAHSVAHRIKSAHKTEKWLQLALHNFPVLLEKKQGKNTRNAFVS